MSTPILDMTVPLRAAHWLQRHRWVRRPGDGIRSGCLHTALLRPCATPGDQIIWHLLERQRGHTEEWNDRLAEDKAEVVTVLRTAPEPTEEEMTELFGPQFVAVRDLVRRAAVVSVEEAARLAECPDADMRARVAARMAAYRVVYAARNLNVPSDAAIEAVLTLADDRVASLRASSNPWDASLRASNAAAAVAVRDLIGHHGFTKHDYRELTRAWATVIGPAHPADERDGLFAGVPS